MTTSATQNRACVGARVIAGHRLTGKPIHRAPGLFSLAVLTLLLCGSKYLNAESATLRGNVAEAGTPVSEGFVYVQQLQDERCAKLIGAYGMSLTKEEKKHLQKCRGHVQQVKTDWHGGYGFGPLEPGWYLISMRWPMASPPDANDAIGCWIQGWSISYVPWKESGKYKGFAQSPPFELHNGEEKKMDFNYDGEFKIQKGCPKPLEWHKK